MMSTSTLPQPVTMRSVLIVRIATEYVMSAMVDCQRIFVATLASKPASQNLASQWPTVSS